MKPCKIVFDLHRKRNISFNSLGGGGKGILICVQLVGELHGTQHCCDHDQIPSHSCPISAVEESRKKVAQESNGDHDALLMMNNKNKSNVGFYAY